MFRTYKFILRTEEIKGGFFAENGLLQSIIDCIYYLVLLFDISNFMIKFNFNTTKDYRNIIKQTHDFVSKFIENNQNKLFVGELFPSSTHPANDCNTFNVKTYD